MEIIMNIKAIYINYQNNKILWEERYVMSRMYKDKQTLIHNFIPYQVISSNYNECNMAYTIYIKPISHNEMERIEQL